MIIAPLPANEEQRLAALRSYDVLDSEFEKEYDDVCRLAAVTCESPIALISLIDQNRQWFKSVVGLDARETPRDISFCSHAILQENIFEVSDATKDERFADNPLVLGKPHIRFYAAQPLINSEGLTLGTLCAIDTVPRILEKHQKEALSILARQIVTHLELRLALAKLRQLNADKDRFLSILAHDLRSPFSGILGLLDVLRGEGPSMSKADILGSVDIVQRSAVQIYKLTENLLQWALVDQGLMVFKPEILSAKALFQNSVEPLTEVLKQKNLKLIEIVPEGATVLGDKNMLEGALRNLVSNAVKFTETDGQITLEFACDSTEVRLSVRDTGTGMPNEQATLLESDYRAVSRSGTDGETGTGLGLAIVREFASRHGGRLELRSQPGQGTTATLILSRHFLDPGQQG